MSTDERAFKVLYGHPERRQWVDARRYGFISARGGLRWSRPLERLDVGNRVLVLVPGKGYVGSGSVTGPPLPVAEAQVDLDGSATPLLSLPLDSPALGWAAGDSEPEEYLVPVMRRGTVAERDAYRRKRLMWRRTSVWPFNDPPQVAEIRDSLEPRDERAIGNGNDGKQGRG